MPLIIFQLFGSVIIVKEQNINLSNFVIYELEKKREKELKERLENEKYLTEREVKR